MFVSECVNQLALIFLFEHVLVNKVDANEKSYKWEVTI